MSQAGKDFSGQNLRGKSFKGQDLTGANFSYADIRGTDFSNTVLEDANFTGVKAGLQNHWFVGLLVLAVVLAFSAGNLIGHTGWQISVYLTAENLVA